MKALKKVLRVGLICFVAFMPGCGGKDYTCDPPKPVLTAMEPVSAKTHSPQVFLTVGGSGFIPDSQVFFDGHLLSTVYVSESQLRAVVPSFLLDKVGPVPVDVMNPATRDCPYGPGLSRDSNALTFTITP